jgi:hypothetical protein
MNCAVHPEVEASGYCRNCGKAMCPACVRPVRDVLYCEECLATVMGVPQAAAAGTGGATPLPGVLPAPSTARPGNAGLAFILGFVPGLGAIYNGEYNKALIHIVIFAGIILGKNLDLGEGADAVLTAALVIFLFYMAIDALRTVKARQSGQAYSDPLENLTQGKALGPILLIGLGVLFLLKNFGVFEFFRFRELFFPVVLIALGVWLMRNRIAGRN